LNPNPDGAGDRYPNVKEMATILKISESRKLTLKIFRIKE
jgi:hypothetical protein